MGLLYFTKKLSKTDVEKRLALPTKYMKHLPEFRGGHQAVLNLPVRDIVDGTQWHFGYTIRYEGHPKPVLSSGWCNFVKHKCLKPGDKIIFNMDQYYNVNVAAPFYTIGVKRRIRLLGKEVWTAVF